MHPLKAVRQTDEIEHIRRKDVEQVKKNVRIHFQYMEKVCKLIQSSHAQKIRSARSKTWSRLDTRACAEKNVEEVRKGRKTCACAKNKAGEKQCACP